jgi:hypothetical protein
MHNKLAGEREGQPLDYVKTRERVPVERYKVKRGYYMTRAGLFTLVMLAAGSGFMAAMIWLGI